jgi:hypothetical protein
MVDVYCAVNRVALNSNAVRTKACLIFSEKVTKFATFPLVIWFFVA